MVAILNSAIFIFFHLGHSDSTWWFSHLSFPLRLLTLAKIDSHYLHRKTSLVHSDSTWWLQPSWILPCQIEISSQHLHKKNSLIHSSAILDSDTLSSSLRFTQKHSLSTLTLTQTNSIWHICILPSWIQPFSSKLWLQLIQSDFHVRLSLCHLGSKSFILTQLDDGSHLGFSHFSQK